MTVRKFQLDGQQKFLQNEEIYVQKGTMKTRNVARLLCSVALYCQNLSSIQVAFGVLLEDRIFDL